MIFNLLNELLHVLGWIDTIFSVVKRARVAPQFRGSFHQNGREPLFRNGKRCGESSQPAPDHQCGLNYFIRSFIKRFQEASPGNRHTHQIFPLFRCSFRFCLMDPGILLPNIRQFKEIRIEPRFPQCIPKQGFMGPRCTRCHQHSIESTLFNCMLNFLLLIIGAGKHAMGCISHIGERTSIIGNRFNVDYTGNIDPAMADKDTNPGFFSAHVSFNRYCRGFDK